MNSRLQNSAFRRYVVLSLAQRLLTAVAIISVAGFGTEVNLVCLALFILALWGHSRLNGSVAEARKHWQREEQSAKSLWQGAHGW
jgi:hypothetical protein